MSGRTKPVAVFRSLAVGAGQKGISVASRPVLPYSLRQLMQTGSLVQVFFLVSSYVHAVLVKWRSAIHAAA